MDKNGYNPSVIEYISDRRCYICGRTDGKLDRHEVFHGANRKKSKFYGLWVTLCHKCHMQLHHQEPILDYKLKRIGQRCAMKEYGWTIPEFIKEWGKNYL